MGSDAIAGRGDREPVGIEETQVKILALGHSHLTALEHGATLMDGVVLRGLQLWGRTMLDPNGFADDLIAEIDGIVAADQPDLILAPIVGAESFALAFSDADRPFDYHSAYGAVAASVAGVEVVPANLVLGRLRETVPYIALAAELARTSGRPVFYPLPPPPTADHAHLLKGLPDEMAARFTATNLPTLALRHKLWRDHSTIITDACVPNGVPVIATPPEAVDDDGCLQSNLMADAVHGNAHYGRLVIQEALRMMEGLRT